MENSHRENSTLMVADMLRWIVKPPRILASTIFALAALILYPILSLADDSSVTVDVAKPNGWIGERIPILVELRTRGTFSGATSFDLPEVPGALLIKIGNLVIGSREIEGDSFIVQTHEFALFSQRVGPVEIPSFPVRFATREGFIGPVTEIRADVPSVQVELKRPPGTDGLGYLVSTHELVLVEQWSSNPGAVAVGDTIIRTVSQRASSVPGMALAPIPNSAPVGVRVYATTPEIVDRTERGAFEGQRKDILTYLVERPGEHILPALVYYWWDPITNQLKSKTLPALTLRVPVPEDPEEVQAGSVEYARWVALLILGAMIACVFWQRSLLARWFHRLKSMVDSPEQANYRKLLKACRQDDGITAYTLWHQLHDLGEPDDTNSPDIKAAISDLERHLYGSPGTTWSGDLLSRALRQNRQLFPALHWPMRQRAEGLLPPLNP